MTVLAAKRTLNSVITSTPQVGVEYFTFADARASKFLFNLKVRTNKNGTKYCAIQEPGDTNKRYLHLSKKVKAAVAEGDVINEKVFQLRSQEITVDSRNSEGKPYAEKEIGGTFYLICGIGEEIVMS